MPMIVKGYTWCVVPIGGSAQPTYLSGQENVRFQLANLTPRTWSLRVLAGLYLTAGSAFFSDALFRAMEFGVRASVTTAGVSLTTYQTQWTTILVSSLVCSILVFVDFNTWFYGRGQRRF
jgi:hypothetical protein